MVERELTLVEVVVEVLTVRKDMGAVETCVKGALDVRRAAERTVELRRARRGGEVETEVVRIGDLVVIAELIGRRLDLRVCIARAARLDILVAVADLEPDVVRRAFCARRHSSCQLTGTEICRTVRDIARDGIVDDARRAACRNTDTGSDLPLLNRLICVQRSDCLCPCSLGRIGRSGIIRLCSSESLIHQGLESLKIVSRQFILIFFREFIILRLQICTPVNELLELCRRVVRCLQNVLDLRLVRNGDIVCERIIVVVCKRRRYTRRIQRSHLVANFVAILL